LFNRIAPRYDFLNHVLSAGFDILWRKKATAILRHYQPRKILDLATGTGDFAIELSSLKPDQIIGLDIAADMLELARQKSKSKRLDGLIRFEEGAAEELRFSSASFDAVTVAFGVRNFSNMRKGLDEIFRVLRKNGVALILEFSRPRAIPLRYVYGFYFERILPLLGGIISGHPEAYRYLPATVREFPDGEGFVSVLRSIGFSSVQHHPLTFGIATIYVGIKQ
jgi:demethylmenaquinone methyltransferase/2-methoxy-6-polyprenyl-1,4-benzoquinol methylase